MRAESSATGQILELTLYMRAKHIPSLHGLDLIGTNVRALACSQKRYLAGRLVFLRASGVHYQSVWAAGT